MADEQQQQQDPSSADDNGLTISTNGSHNNRHHHHHQMAIMRDETTPLLAVSSRIDKDENDANYSSILNYARRLIYVSHCFSQFR
jgi:hypothetical protein